MPTKTKRQYFDKFMAGTFIGFACLVVLLALLVWLPLWDDGFDMQRYATYYLSLMGSHKSILLGVLSICGLLNIWFGDAFMQEIQAILGALLMVFLGGSTVNGSFEETPAPRDDLEPESPQEK